jgi:cyclic beta-1,2-glucan synthetase
VTAADNDLPPDNFQETPQPVLARRTSPTNIGLYLLATTAAHDLGWIGRAEATARLERTLATLQRMPRFRGHLYNWYTTDDLRVLDPAYVSTVDSGNLAGHLIAVAQACAEWRRSPIPEAGWRAGLSDTLLLASARSTSRRGRRTAQLADVLARNWRRPRRERAARPAPGVEQGRRRARPVAGRPEPGGGFWTGAVHGCLASHAADRDQTLSAPCRCRAAGPRSRDRRWSSASCSTGTRSCCRSAFRSPPTGWIPAAMTFSPPRRGWRACSPSPRAMSRPATGSAWAARPRPMGAGSALISWSGSMFEYLMPSLVMRAPAGSVLAETNRRIVARQQAHGAALGIPWGISESAYNARDLEMTYQYSNFGVPGLGLKRGLSENRVIAPYATGLAAMVAPAAALRNFARLAALGPRGGSASTRRWISPPRACPRGRTAPSCAASWRIIRA